MRVQGTLAALLAAFAVLGTACSGGESGGGAVTPSQQPVTVTTSTLAAAAQGQAYNAAITASGGTGTGFTWNIIAGALPAGLMLSPTGTPSAAITGTPSVDGTFNFTVQAVDSAGGSGSAPLQLDVTTAPPLMIAATPLASGQQGQAYNATVTASGGSGLGYSWVVLTGALPAGVSLAPTGSPSTSLDGIPTLAGTFNFTVQVTDSIGLTGTRALQLVVAPAPTLTITTTQLGAGLPGQAYNDQVVATGGSGVGYSWSIIAGALPGGVTLAATGTPAAALAGTPAAVGTYNFTVRVEDSIGLAATAALQIVIVPPVAITTTTLPGGNQGQPYAATVGASGGSGAGYTWSITGGVFPAGMTLAPTGTPSTSLGGTPTVSGTFNFTLRVQDSFGFAATQILQIVLVPMNPLMITSTATPPDATLNVAYQHTITATGGSNAGYQWAVIQGALPAGVTLGAAGTPSTNLAGSSIMIGRFTFTVQVTDSLSNAASLAITLIVVSGSPAGAWSLPFTGPLDRAGTAVFTGSRLIQWGGFTLNGIFFTPNVTNEGEVFLPQTGQSAPVNLAGAPAARADHTAIWTGSRMLVFGGRNDQMVPFGDLREYDPVTNLWATLSTTGAPSARFQHTAVWSGTEMIIWGGMTATGTVSDGAAYNPSTNLWRPLAAPSIAVNTRFRHKAVWTGTEMIIWGGENQPAAAPPSQTLYDGAVYDPATNTWPQTISVFGAPLLSAEESTVVWTGTKMLVWGYSEGVSAQVGAVWDPATSWALISTTNQPTARRVHSSTWTGTKLYVWGGLDTPGSTFAVNDGGVYDPATNTWAAMGAQGAPFGRFVHHALWTGREFIAWGGRDMGFSGSNPQNTGAVYTP